MKKIIVVSDSHLKQEALNTILNRHPDADNYFHLGDSETFAKNLKPFISVMGNNDFDQFLPIDRIIDIDNHSFYLTHSHMYSADYNLMSKVAKANGCDVVLFGHIHEFVDKTINGIHFINPGSCRFNRYFDDPTYAVLTLLDNGKIEVEKIYV